MSPIDPLSDRVKARSMMLRSQLLYYWTDANITCLFCYHFTVIHLLWTVGKYESNFAISNNATL